jgi:dTDP-4-amino-4,6-dideoxygalactose transaminase
MSTIPLAAPLLDGNEGAYLQECVDSGFVSSVGPFVTRFETEFAAAVGSPHAVACSTGTAALHVALRLAGVKQGDLVAASTFTFIASINAIAYLGARPLLVDSERQSWNLDSQQLHDELLRRSRAGEELPAAIVPVHILGQPAQMEPLLAASTELGIPIVEDAAEALGATWTTPGLDGTQTGTAGLLGCYSFNGNKLMTTGGGGMIVTDDAELAQRARHLTTQARTPGLAYLHDEIGYNYRLTNTAAALGVAQLERLPELLAAKARIAAVYDDALADLPVSPAPIPPWGRTTRWLCSFLLGDGAPPVEDVLRSLQAQGVEARPLWLPMHRQPPYREAEMLGSMAVADDLYAHGLSLPCGAGLTDEEQVRVVAAFRDALS